MNVNHSYIWHPFTQAKTDLAPIPVKRASGSLIYDIYGNTYIDAVSSWWVNLHGHAHPHISAAIKAQLDELHQVIFAGCTHEPAQTLCTRLAALLPIEKPHFFFSDNGSTSIEVALKIAIQYARQSSTTKKSRFLYLSDSYHGDTFGAMGVSERGFFTTPFLEHLLPADKLPHPSADFSLSIKTLKNECQKGDVLAFTYEPLIQGASGMKFYTAEQLEEMLRICKSHEVLCIADEVFTGFGRSGTLFASEQTHTKPDIVCLSKALTGGTLPLGLTVASEEIWERFQSDRKEYMLLHGHSFTGNPLACTAALASLDLIEKEDFKQNLKRISDFYKKTAEEAENWAQVKNVRHKGLVFALDVETKDSGYKSSIKDTLYPFFLKNGVLLRPLGNVIYTVPPVCITDEELTKVFSTLREGLRLI